MSTVVVAKHGEANPEKGLSQQEYAAVLTAALKSLSGKSDIKAAVRNYFPGGVVGMKTNCIARKLNSTPVALVDALSELLTGAGFDDNDVVVWERTGHELERAGYKLNASSFGRRCFGTDAGGMGYSREFFESGEVNSLVSRILTDVIDHNINVPILKDHSLAGMSAGLKNMYGAINNPNKYHDGNCSPFAAHISNLPPIRQKSRLSVIDAVRVQYNGGPGYMANYMAYYGAVVVSDDPVAADRVALEILEYLRKANKAAPLEKVGRSVRYLDVAAQLGLGAADMSNIDLTVLTVGSDGATQPGGLF